MARENPKTVEAPLRGDVLEITGESDVHSALKTIEGRRDKVLKNLAKQNPDASVAALNSHLDKLVGYHTAQENIRQQMPSQKEADEKRPGPIRRAWNAIPGWVKALGVGAVLFLLFRQVRNNEKFFAQAAHDTAKDVAKATNAVTPTVKLTGEGAPSTDAPMGTGTVDAGKPSYKPNPRAR